MATTTGDRMSATDSILWRIERDPVLRSTVTAISLLDRAPDWEELRSRMLQASLRIPRMRQVVAEPPLGVGSPSWVMAEAFDLDYHLRRVRLSPPATFASVLEYAAQQAMSEFDRARPLWEFTVVEGVGDGAALIQKFHHAVTDGVGGMKLALEILDTEARPRRKVVPVPSLAGAPSLVALRPLAADTSGLSAIGRAAEASIKTLARAGRRAAGLEVGLAGAAVQAGKDPVASARSLADSVRWGARLVAPVSEPLSPIMRSRGIIFSFAAFDVDFDRLRAAGKRAHGSLNDAFIASVGAGLRRYHEAHGARVTSLRMTLPISIRSEHDAAGGNRFVPVRFEVPLEPSDPGVTIPAISRLVREWRDGPALGLTDALASVLNGLPTPAVTQVFGSMLRNVDFVATNVPGLPVPTYLAGAELLRQYAFAPPSGSALNVALLSHVGHCCIGVNIDRAAITDPDLLVSCLQEGFDEIILHAVPHVSGHRSTGKVAARSVNAGAPGRAAKRAATR
ncbi:MAG: wax ester/triacylglycerol synthase domain-containing protein [Acidimicrobiales bacterium]|jgi:WS/DGAT/MGAT family acyltransferase